MRILATVGGQYDGSFTLDIACLEAMIAVFMLKITNFQKRSSQGSIGDEKESVCKI